MKECESIKNGNTFRLLPVKAQWACICSKAFWVLNLFGGRTHGALMVSTLDYEP